MNRNGQIAIEFLLLIGMAFIIVLVMLVSMLSMSERNTKIKSYEEMNDLGKSLQQEFLLASELEDGYTRKINLPLTLNGLTYTASVGTTNHTNTTNSYILLNFQSIELYYAVPHVSGYIQLGDNILVKYNDTLILN